MDTPDNALPKPTVEIDQMKLQQHLQELRDNQNLAAGVLGGALAAAAGALAWAVITYLTHYQIGFMAIGVGFLVGYAVRVFGKGIDTGFGVVGGFFSLAGCLAGNLLAVCIYIANEEGMGVMQVLSRLDLSIAAKMLVETFSPMDILFYGFALYYGYKYSFHRIDEATLKGMTRPAGR